MPPKKPNYVKPSVGIFAIVRPRAITNFLLSVNIICIILMALFYGNDLRRYLFGTSNAGTTTVGTPKIVIMPVEREWFDIKAEQLTQQKLLHSTAPARVPNQRTSHSTLTKLPTDAPGEMGKPVYLPKNMSADMRMAVEEGWAHHQFNQYVSDMISVHRTLPDLRNAWCKQPGRFLKNLPSTDVIICFYNEAWSTLLRSVHSVLNRSPPKLINKIILVDDYSDMAHTKAKLDAYFKNNAKVQIIHATRREGLIRARLLGASHATAPVLTFLDSHVECAEGWLEPLLDRIARNGTAVVYPNIEIIRKETFEYVDTSMTPLIGGFDWDLEFKWIQIPERVEQQREHSTAPIHSPTMPGGIFSINRTFFEYLGTYDSGFLIWGAENLELSFKTWMCGGTLEMIPCSLVGHVFRSISPYESLTLKNKLRNLARLAEVWMDNYAKLFYRNVVGAVRDVSEDIKTRQKFRASLNCKNFKWYLENVYPELEVPTDLLAAGEIRNLAAGGTTCLDMTEISSVGLWPCHGTGGNQYWIMTDKGEIRHYEVCLEYFGHEVTTYKCHGETGNQLWSYDSKLHQIKHNYSLLCLSISLKRNKLIMEKCDSTNLRQHWVMELYDSPT